MLLREDHREVRLGGAANVANMLRGLDARVTMAGVVGDDEDGRELQHQLARAGVETDLVVIDPTRPTTVKTRVFGRAQHRHPHQVLRLDRESRDPLGGTIAADLIAALVTEIHRVDAVLVSDYAKGVCTPELLASVIAAARQAGVPVIVDPASVGDYAPYRRATAMTPNRAETGRATERTIRTVEDGLAAAELLREQLALEATFVTLDSDGIALATDDGPGRHMPTRRREVYDITGAGDMVLATIGLVAAAGGSPEMMAGLANIAGGLEVEQIGVVTISRAEMIADLLGGPRSAREKIHDLESLVSLVSARRETGQRIVMTNGCFDLFHAGHVACLEQAAAEGDCLIVAINSDESVRGLGKAPGRPIVPQDQRGALLAALEVVDFVVVFDEPTPLAAIEAVRPDVLVKGGTYTLEEIVGRELVESYKGVVKPLGLVPGLSTTEIIAKIRDLEETPQQPWRQAG